MTASLSSDHADQTTNEAISSDASGSAQYQPKAQISAPAAIAEPVVIGHDQEPPEESWDVMINLAAQVPDFFSRYQRVAEVVDSDEQRRNQGRERFRYYRERGYELRTHRL